HIIFLSLSQLDKALLTLSLVVFPKYVIDALSAQDARGAIAYAAMLVIAQCALRPLDSWFLTKYFLARLHIADEFSAQMHGVMADADYARLESEAYHEQRARAQKFLYCDWHGFAYILDSAFAIVGQLLTLIGMSAVLSGLSGWLLIVFSALVTVDAYASARAKKRAIALNLEQVAVERRWGYVGNILEEHRYGKEIRLFGLKGWLLDLERKAGAQAHSFYALARQYWMRADGVCAVTNAIRLGAGYAWLLARVLSGALGIGDFAMYSAAMTSFAAAMSAMLNGAVDIWQYGAYYDAMMAFLSVPRTLRDSGHDPLPEAPYTFKFEHVSFRYPGRTDDALHDINLELHAGESLSVVGENGAGKTTFVKLLMRLYVPTQGRITLNGKDIMEIDADQYMRLFAPVFQDFNLFAYTLRENVAFNSPGDVTKVLKRAGLSDLLDRLPNGVETPAAKTLDDAGFEPSGGEAQKIALARALFKDSPVVILDEPTAALDPRAEYELYRQFHRLILGKTAVFISHRMSSARFCDRVLVFKGGEVIESGPHERLMNEGGLYAELFRMQAEFYADR
nr:ABC transporter ATP-binding protein [Clostridia bacterium]